MHTQRGATLIELFIGLVIMGILIAAGVPTFRTWVQNTQIRTAAESVQNGLQVARNEAVRRNANVAFQLGSGSGWSVVVVKTGATVQSRAKEEGSDNVTVLVTPSASTMVTFTGLGRIVTLNADGTSPITRLNFDVPTTILPAASSRDLQIDISPGGQIRMCDPNVSATTDPRKC